MSVELETESLSPIAVTNTLHFLFAIKNLSDENATNGAMVV
jgi:hypothetical protein